MVKKIKKALNTKKIFQLSGFYIFLSFEKFLMLLPKGVRRTFFIFLGKLAYILSKRYKKVVRDNIIFVYGDSVNEAFITKVSKYQFKLLLLNLLQTIESKYYSIDEIKKNVTIINDAVIKKVQEEGRPIIFITSHYGAWELGGGLISALYEPLLIVYKKMKNPYFENYLLSSRAKWKISYVERHGATRAILKRLRSNKAIAILIDTNINKKEAITVNFLGHDVSQIKTTAYFARKFNAAIIPVLIHSDDDIHHQLEFAEEIVPPKTSDEKEDIKVSTQMQTDWLTKEILKRPEPWFWLHRRFKDDYPEIYK